MERAEHLSSIKQRFSFWFLEGMKQQDQKEGHPPEQAEWWQVMCLTGVDYFSSLGYAPGIAFIAAGLLSPIATIVLVLLTLGGALPVYRNVAAKSPHGQGSIFMLEHLFPGWRGKLLVLCLLGFAGTDFIITITLSAADAATHLVQNPWMPFWLHNRLAITLFMLLVLGAIFLKGFHEAISVCVILVSVYLSLNFVVLSVATYELLKNLRVVADWSSNLFAVHGSIGAMLALSCLLFPKLALGMSGFETGVAVMPLVKGVPGDDPAHPSGRIKHTKSLLGCAALIMSVFLIFSSFTTTMLIPATEFLPAGAANGRALAFLAHRYLGDYFGTAYDISTLLILWFAGASAMAGLVNLVPRYLPRYGMAPDWARARRPLVTFYTVVACTVTWLFKADVDAQGGAYATGVLVLMTSAAFASMLNAWHASKRQFVYFAIVTLVFIYTAIVNALERPDGIKIASFFIAVILLISLISRIVRSTELRVTGVNLDANAESFLAEAGKRAVCLVAHRPGNLDYGQKAAEAIDIHHLSISKIIFVEVSISDASDFGDDVLEWRGETVDQFRVLRCTSSAVPNALAALLLYIRDRTACLPHLYLGWTEGSPIVYILKYLFLGEGETAPLTREILREAEPNPANRPKIHVG